MKRKSLIVLLISVGLVFALALVNNYFKGVKMDKVTAERQKRQERLEHYKEIQKGIIEIDKLLGIMEAKLGNQENVAQVLDSLMANKEVVDDPELRKENSVINEFVNKLNSLEELTKNASPEPGVLLAKVREIRQYLEENKKPPKK